jgi:ribA/ribD-fused uncharacterized protein
MIDFFDGEYAFLSNFYNASCIFEEKLYPTVEHAFQAAKSLDHAERDWIAAAGSPGLAKRLGRSVNLRADWEKIKFNVMEECLRSKFSDPILKQKLLATGDEELVGGNYWHDNTYGNCSCEKCKDIVGRNMLGNILMKLRTEFMEEN